MSIQSPDSQVRVAVVLVQMTPPPPTDKSRGGMSSDLAGGGVKECEGKGGVSRLSESFAFVNAESRFSFGSL